MLRASIKVRAYGRALVEFLRHGWNQSRRRCSTVGRPRSAAVPPSLNPSSPHLARSLDASLPPTPSRAGAESARRRFRLPPDQARETRNPRTPAQRSKHLPQRHDTTRNNTTYPSRIRSQPAVGRATNQPAPQRRHNKNKKNSFLYFPLPSPRVCVCE